MGGKGQDSRAEAPVVAAVGREGPFLYRFEEPEGPLGRGELGAGEEAELLYPKNKPLGEHPQVKSVKQLQ